MNRIVLVFALFILFSTGCATKQTVLVDGLPMPSTSHLERNNSTDMRIEVNFMRMVWEKEEDKEKGKEYLFPAEALKVNNGELQVLPKNTEYVRGDFRVVNPHRKEYFVQVRYTFDHPEEETSNTVSRIIYKGDARDSVFNVGRAENAEINPQVEARVIIFINGKNNEPVFDFFVRYQVEN